METYYLPDDLRATVETHILVNRPELAAKILDFDEVFQDGFHLPAVVGTDFAMLDLVHHGVIELPVYYCVIAAPAVNAIVTRFRDFYCIVISEGLYGHVYPIAAGLLAHDPLRTFLAGGKLPHDDGGPPKRSRRDAFVWLHAHGVDRADQEAIRLTRFYVEIITYLVVAHEIGHIVGGHLDSKALAPSLISEADAVVEETGDHKRALEIDADMFASLATAMFIGRQASGLRWKALNVDATVGMRMLFASAYLLFSVMDLFGPDDALLRRQKGHPAPLLRSHMLTGVVANTVPQLSNYDLDSIWDQGVEAVRAIEIALYEIAGGMMEESEAAAYGDAATSMWTQHLERWPAIVKDLNRTRREAYFWAATLR